MRLVVLVLRYRGLPEIRRIDGRSQGEDGAARSAHLWGPRAQRGRMSGAGPLDAGFSALGRPPVQAAKIQGTSGAGHYNSAFTMKPASASTVVHVR
jgi:hypothetical protein